MIRLEVIVADSDSTNIIANPSNNALELASFYREKMTDAAVNKAEILYFEGIEFAEKRSTNFQNINIIEKGIMDFLYENEYPKKVCIVCDSPEKAELYKVVYNFYYPETEGEKLEDVGWK